MIFLDNASTTAMCKEALEVYSRYSVDMFYNPSAPYNMASLVSLDIDSAKTDMLKKLSAPDNSKLIFTSGATEANNTALLGALNKSFKKVLISVGEHSSVYVLASHIQSLGYTVELLPLNNLGQVDIDAFKDKMDKDVGLVAIMHVSNETGAINDIEQLVKLAKSVNPSCHFHCDGVQAMGKIEVRLSALDVDSYSFSAHKFHGPKGVGGLIYRKPIKPYILGGGQQFGMRSGTENVASIMAMCKAFSIIDVDARYKHVKALNDAFREKLQGVKGVTINSPINASPYVLSISFEGVNGATLVNMLENFGILIGTGSACSTKKQGNVTLEAMGVSTKHVLGSVRVSFCAFNTLEEVQTACQKIIECYERLKKLSGVK